MNTKDSFLDSYIETALWSSTDENGNPLDGIEYADTELAEETITAMQTDCQEFKRQAETLFATAGLSSLDYHVAHDFWLTRNGHGAGFWDRGKGQAGNRLTDAAHVYGEVNLYIDTEGKIRA